MLRTKDPCGPIVHMMAPILTPWPGAKHRRREEEHLSTEATCEAEASPRQVVREISDAPPCSRRSYLQTCLTGPLTHFQVGGYLEVSPSASAVSNPEESQN